MELEYRAMYEVDEGDPDWTEWYPLVTKKYSRLSWSPLLAFEIREKPKFVPGYYRLKDKENCTVWYFANESTDWYKNYELVHVTPAE